MPAAKCYILHSLYRFEQVSKYFPHISCYFLVEMEDGENIQKSQLNLIIIQNMVKLLIKKRPKVPEFIL